MDSRIREAARKKKSGAYNCAQAVACTYCDYAGIDEETMKKITQAFGVGMGTLEGNCGALTGAGVVLGLANSDKAATVRAVRTIMNEFSERNGTVTCKTLKGIGTGVVLRECEDCVKDAAEFLERQLKK